MRHCCVLQLCLEKPTYISALSKKKKFINFNTSYMDSEEIHLKNNEKKKKKQNRACIKLLGRLWLLFVTCSLKTQEALLNLIMWSQCGKMEPALT